MRRKARKIIKPKTKTKTRRTTKRDKKVLSVAPVAIVDEPIVFPKTKFWTWGDPKSEDSWSKQVDTKTYPIQPKSNPAIAGLDEKLDEFYNSNYKLCDTNAYNLITEGKFKPQEVRAASDLYQGLVNDLRDPKAKEGYTHLKPRQKSNYITFLEKMIEDCQLFLGNSRKSSKVRKPRKKKIKSVDQLTAKVKFKAEDVSLKMVSVAPSTIVGAIGVWLFNTKTRRLTYLAAGGTGSLSIKGTTVIRFDPEISKQKKIRKPEWLQDVLSGTKASMLKSFGKLKTKEYVANGRINGDTLILKVIK